MMLLIVMLLWRRPSPRQMLFLLLAEVLLVNTLIAINGAASNPFNAVLLLPVVLAFMLLSWLNAAMVLSVSIAFQISQLWLLPRHGDHAAMMLSHYYGMVVGFVLTAVLVAAVVWYLRQRLASREEAIHQLRERQLRNEQLLAIGTAAAQLTHDVATPVQSMRLLIDEIKEQQTTSVALTELDVQLQRVEQQLRNWREVADDVRESRLRPYAIKQLWHSLQHLLLLARPETPIRWHWLITAESRRIYADGTLLPALSNIIINACEAAQGQADALVHVSANTTDSHWRLKIENPANGVSPDLLLQLGFRLLPSDGGHGVGAVLTNATIEKFHGEVNWCREGDMIVTLVELPLEFHAENHSD
ncbi:HAMP domain-containing histidine kinase [Shewanella sp. 4t3-1-2LB]|jgi:two-component system sensor histidine kinase RegB|uniref:ATP-binding protein n=1 Tax=Shewanella sp. 4t3-1-2LB TaxID=2817682 RepID=UPI001A989624|nr:ATP-binding protein [Shewanella sp. 4t3-1-2LB]MBO1270756.1 HAMP domain-containing histidine kinase [Shewanella sp. 4t3-1-2LB]